MAVKSKAQVQALAAAMAALDDAARTWLAGTFTTDVQAVTDAIAAGDDQPEDADQNDAVKAVLAAGDALMSAIGALFKTLHPTLGRYASSPNLKDRERNWAAFHDKLTTDAEAITSSGASKFSSWSAGSNQGNGDFVVHNTDPAALAMDCSHVETLKLRCTKDSSVAGVIPGAEVFELTGGAAGDQKWEEGGSAGGTYKHTHGFSVNDWAADQPKIDTGGTLKSVGDSTAAGNLIAGDYEATFGSGTGKIPGWTITAGDSLISADTTNHLKGSQCMAASGNFTKYFPLTTSGGGGISGIGTLRAYALRAHIQRRAGVTGGTATVKVLDDSATHVTLTQDIATLVDNTWTKMAPTAFVLPRTVGKNLRVEVQVASHAGSGNVLFDCVILAPLMLHDSGRCIGILAGTTADWRINDTATGETTGTKAGFQRCINVWEGRYVKHAGTPVGSWP